MRWLLDRLEAGRWLPAFLALIIAALPAAETSPSRFLPVFQSDSSGYLGLSLVNTGDSSNEVSITWTDSEGKIARTGRLSLLPGAQRAFLVREILGTALDPEEGWIRIDSSGPGLLSYMTFGADRTLDGTEAALQPATSMVLDYVKVNTGFVELDYADTSLIIVNPGVTAANARVDLIALDGIPTGSVPVLIPSRGSRTMRISESFRNVLPPGNPGGRKFDGYAKIFSDAALAAWLRIDTPLSVRLLRGRAISEIDSASQLLAAHFASGGSSLYRSTLNLINTGDASAKLELIAQDDRGRSVGGSVNLSLSPGQGLREDVLNLFRIVQPAIFPPPLVTGYIRIRASGGSPFRITGDIDIHSGSNVAAALFPIAAATSREWTLPFVVNGREYFTGYAIVNVNELLTVQTDVTLELLDIEGRPAAAPGKISLSPSARFEGLVEKEISSGYLRIRSNGPLVVLGSIGTCSGSTLAFLPAPP